MRFFFRAAATLVLMAASWGCQADDGATTPGGVGGSAAGSAGQPGQGGSGGVNAGAAGQAGGTGGSGGTAGMGGSGGGDAGAAGSAPPKDPIQLRVATFNAENFFNDKADDPPPVGAEEKLSPGEYQAKLAGVAAIVAKTNADVIMLEEVENDAVLAALQARPELGGKYVDRAIFKGNDPRGIDIGALSTVPFTKKVSHKDDEFALAGTGGSDKYRFARDLLEVHADVNGRHMIFLGVHLKAKSNDDPQKRLAEAQRARFVADTRRKEDPSAFVVILGDFNDFPGSPPMNAVQGEAPNEIYEGMGAQLGSALSWSVFSQSAPGGKALHDDLRVCPPLFERVVKGSIKIFHDEDLEPSLQKVSDHAPVAATFQIN